MVLIMELSIWFHRLEATGIIVRFMFPKFLELLSVCLFFFVDLKLLLKELVPLGNTSCAEDSTWNGPCIVCIGIC